ncbi:hypothetical protein EI94DRAFT_1792383, partial [Lactarius quietus]
MVLLYALAYCSLLFTGCLCFHRPIAKLDIVNKVISPDGTLALLPLQGGIPWPYNTWKKGGYFSINVTDHLEDTSMDLATSIVRPAFVQSVVESRMHSPTALARYIPKGYELRRRRCLVTQCPLVPGESFLYKFNVFDQTGTYWYHGHFKNQYCDGLRGALIIEDPDDPQRYLYDIDDDSTVISLADWYHAFSTVPPTFHAFNSSLINGKGSYPGNPSTDVELAVVNVQKGQTVQANQPVGNYWIRSLPNAAGQNFSGLNNLAVLHYAGAAKANPTYDPTSDVPVSQMLLVETNLHPLTNSPVNHPFQPGNPVPGGADININLAVVQ